MRKAFKTYSHTIAALAGLLALMFAPLSHADGLPLPFGEGENIGKYIVNTIMGGMDGESTDVFGDIFGTISYYLNALLIIALIIVSAKHALEFLTIKVTNPNAEGLPATIIIVRALIALFMLLPWIGSGYSSSQMSVKKAADLSVFMADTAIVATTKHFSGENGESTVLPTILEGVSDVVWSIYMSQVCHELVHTYYALEIGRDALTVNQVDAGLPFTITKDKSSHTINYQWGWKTPYPNNTTYSASNYYENSGDEPTLCGSIKLELPEGIRDYVRPPTGGGLTLTIDSSNFDPDSRNSKHQASQVLAHHNAIMKASALASKSVESLFFDKYLTNLLTGKKTDSKDGEIAAEIPRIKDETTKILANIPQYAQDLLEIDQLYHEEIRRSGQKIAKDAAKDQISNGNNWLEKLEIQGFAALGAYYMTSLNHMVLIDSFQKHIVKPANSPFYLSQVGKVEIPDELKPILDQETFNAAKPRIQAILLDFSKNKTVSKLSLDFNSLTKVQEIGGERSAILDITNKFGRIVTNTLETKLIKSTHNDLLLNLVDIGIIITSLMEIVFLGAMVLALGGSVLTGIGGLLSKTPFGAVATVVGKGALGSLVGGLFSKALSLILPFILALSLVGLMLKFVLPFMPLFKWLFALQSWSMMLFIAMIYAPMWMLSFGISSSQRWIDEGAKDGFLMYVEIILYPILMCAGFFGAQKIMFVTDIAVRVIMAYLIGLADGGVFGPFSASAVLVLSTYAAYVLITRTFCLIYELPNTVLTRFGAKPLGDIDQGTDSSVFVGITRAFANPKLPVKKAAPTKS